MPSGILHLPTPRIKAGGGNEALDSSKLSANGRREEEEGGGVQRGAGEGDICFRNHLSADSSIDFGLRGQGRTELLL